LISALRKGECHPSRLTCWLNRGRVKMLTPRAS